MCVLKLVVGFVGPGFDALHRQTPDGVGVKFVERIREGLKFSQVVAHHDQIQYLNEL